MIKGNKSYPALERFLTDPTVSKKELMELKDKFGDERRTEIAGKAEEIEMEDLIVEEDMAITISNTGYVKRIPVQTYRKQKRGGKGVTSMTTKEEDFVERLFVASSKDYLLIFSNKGIVRWLKVYEIPVASRQAKGKAIVNLLSFDNDEQISAIVAVKEFKDDEFLIMATAKGVVKKTMLSAYGNPRKGGIIGITLEKDDRLIAVEISDGKKEVLLATRLGKSLRFQEKQLRDMGRGARGVRGIGLAPKDLVVGMIVFDTDADKTGNTLLTCSSLGYAKRSKFEDYRVQSRGGKGIINLKCTPKNGHVVNVLVVHEDDEMMAVTRQGMMIRCNPGDVRVTGRSAVGVRLVSMGAGDEVASVANVVAREDDVVEE